MHGSYFYHGLIRKYVSIFGTIFNSLLIKRRNSSNVVTEQIKVPLAYGPKQKFLTRIQADPSLEERVGMKLPRMGFEMLSLAYNPERVVHPLTKLSHKNASNNYGTVRMGVPYDFSFNLFIMVKNADDGSQIVEQILPYFKPDFTVSLRVLPTMDISHDIPITLQSINVDDSYEGDFLARRALIYTLDFTLKGILYPNIMGRDFGDGSDSSSLPLIRTSLVNFLLLQSDAPMTDTEYLALETNTPYKKERDYILYEDGHNILSEQSGTALNKALVKSRVTASVPDNSLFDDDYDVTIARDFYNEGLEI